MIEILKKGTKRTLSCRERGCFFSYEKEDISFCSSSTFGYQPKEKYLFCPQCKKKIVLEALK